MHVVHHKLTVECYDEHGARKNAEVTVEVIVDTAAIARFLGRKALNNKSKRSKIVGDDVIVNVLHDVPRGWKRTGY